MMLQRRMKALAVLFITSLVFASCKKNTYSADEPLTGAVTPSVFVSSQNKILYALDPITGAYKWEYNLRRTTVATPLVVGDYLYVPTSVDTIFKFNVKTGAYIKSITLPYPTSSVPAPTIEGVISSPVADAKNYYIGTAKGKIFAMNPSDDQIKWTADINDDLVGSLTMYSGLLLVATKNKITTLDAATGTIRWQVNTPGGVLTSSPAVAAPYIYIGSDDFNLYALNMSDGSTAWKFTTLGIVNSSPIVYGGNVIFGSADNYVYCLDSAARQARWKFKSNDRVMSSAQAYGQVIYIGGYDSYIYALNIVDGSMKWRYKTNALIQASPVAANGGVFVAGYDKMIYKIDTSGLLKWSYNIGGIADASPIYYDISRTYYPSITGMYTY